MPPESQPLRSRRALLTAAAGTAAALAASAALPLTAAAAEPGRCRQGRRQRDDRDNLDHRFGYWQHRVPGPRDRFWDGLRRRGHEPRCRRRRRMERQSIGCRSGRHPVRRRVRFCTDASRPELLLDRRLGRQPGHGRLRQRSARRGRIRRNRCGGRREQPAREYRRRGLGCKQLAERPRCQWQGFVQPVRTQDDAVAERRRRRSRCRA